MKTEITVLLGIVILPILLKSMWIRPVILDFLCGKKKRIKDTRVVN